MPTTHTLTANGSTPAQGRTPSESSVIIVVSYVAGTGTVDLEVSVDGSTWVKDGDVTFTASGVARFRVHPDLQYRATLSGSATPDIDITFLEGRDS